MNILLFNLCAGKRAEQSFLSLILNSFYSEKTYIALPFVIINFLTHNFLVFEELRMQQARSA